MDRLVVGCLVVDCLHVIVGPCPSRRTSIRRVDLYDFLRGLIIVGSYLFLTLIELSRVYHYIRGEAIIKLYVIFNILEVRPDETDGSGVWQHR